MADGTMNSSMNAETLGVDNSESGITLEQVQELAKYVENGELQAADLLIEQITLNRDQGLFQALGKLTRDFHESLQNFRFDSRLNNLAEEEIPEARDRLRYVVTMTAQAADKTLTAAEDSLPVCKDLIGNFSELSDEWKRLTQREMSGEEFRQLSKRLTHFFAESGPQLSTVETSLNDVIMAQDFQDLTGQIIGQVINLVDDVETNLVELIRLSGEHLKPPPPQEKQKEKEEKHPNIEAHGPTVPGVDTTAETVSGQDEVDDLLSSLGF